MYDLSRKSLCCTLALVLFAAQTAEAQQTTPTAAPVPAPITEARTVFLSNAGADAFFFNYSGGNDRAYNNLYAAIKHADKYRIVPSPSEADLILEIRSTAPSSGVSGTDGTVSTTYSPQLRLQILDPATRTVLWTLTSYIHAGVGLQKTRDRQFDDASNVLFDQLRQLTGETLTPQEARAAQARPGTSRGTRILFAILLASAVVLPIVLLLHFRNNQPKLPTLPPCTTPFCPVA